MTQPGSQPEINHSQEMVRQQEVLELKSKTDKQIGEWILERTIISSYNMPLETAYAREAAQRLMRLDRLAELLGMLAPGGTAPRTALEQIFLQASDNADESQIVLDLRRMLEQHWGDWTPALREAEGLPPAAPTNDSE